MKATAAVTQEAKGPFVLQEVDVDEPQAHEVLVRIVGVGLCHTDLAARDGWISTLGFPVVLGHEGSGIVEKVGSAVTKVVPGDRVLLSFMSCGTCRTCSQGDPAYCNHFPELNLSGKRSDGSTAYQSGEEAIASHFFGQSSFATLSVAHERNVIKVPSAVPLEMASVLGCGVQTGAGAVLRSVDCRPGSSLLVIGGGAVGLSAVMAAKARGVAKILISEQHPKRRELAKELGATDLIDPSADSLTEQVLSVVPGGVDYILDNTGVPEVIEQISGMLARRGSFGFVGLPPMSHAQMTLPAGYMDAMRRGLTFRGIIEGDSDLDPFLTELMDLYLEGRFPFDKLIQTFSLDQINEAVAAQKRGECVKVVLIP